MSKEAVEILDYLVEKLGPLGIEVWQAYVFQQYVTFCIRLILSLALIVVYLNIINWFNKQAWPETDHTLFDMRDLSILKLVLQVAVFTICSLIISLSIGHIINPKYYAIKEIFNLRR